MLKSIAIDDEPLALEIMKHHAATVDFISLDEVFLNSEDGLQYLNSNKVDLLFLDIKMPGLNGIELIKKLQSPPLVIFTTAYGEYALKSYEMDVVDYLLKPFSEERFMQACKKAQKINTAQSSVTDFLIIKDGYSKVKINYHHILFFQAAGNYVQIVLEDRKLLTRWTLASLEKMLDVKLFARVHRSYIVSRSKVDRIEKSSLIIQGYKIPQGEGYENFNF